MVLSCVVEPGIVGFNMGDVEVIEKLPEQVWFGLVWLMPIQMLERVLRLWFSIELKLTSKSFDLGEIVENV